MSCDHRTVAACVFQGHEGAALGRHECPLVQVLARRVHNLGIEDEPACIDRELNKYRAVARVLDCPLLAQLSRLDVSPQPVISSSGCADPIALPRTQRRLSR